MDSAAERYRQMRTIRRFEETALEQLHEGNVPGPLHLSIGQEGVAVGACAPLRATDAITSAHRGHHHCLAKGAELVPMFAELLGREAGYCRGRGGSMHIAVPALGILGTNGIVGGGIPIAVGSAFAMQVQQRDDVTVCFFGEGAAATGAFGEALNIAGVWSLPLVMVCENNHYVELMSNEGHVAGAIWRRAEGYGIEGMAVDGTDVDAMAQGTAAAVAKARAGGGATLIEAESYRWHGHQALDKAAYRPEGELERWQSTRDPLARARSALGPAADAIDAEVEDRIHAALQAALASPQTSQHTAELDIYATA